MSMKRSRAAYEKDLKAQQSPYVSYGTPLPPLDPDVRDDGSYVPVWKQEVTDERGRKRLHGAFTGGFSAGYFNTVGSKEGWAPSTFVSSRSNRKETKTTERRPEDYMDEEDLANIAEHERVTTTAGFAALGFTDGDVSQRGAFVDLFKTEGETMGVKLLRKMGWRDGQGIGPKVRRAARLDDGTASSVPNSEHLFAPENTKMVSFARKTDHKGLGFSGGEKLEAGTSKGGEPRDDEDEGETVFGTAKPAIMKKKKKPIRGGIGIGVLNDTGSDDEDPYEIGPRISYNRTIGSDKKKKKAVAANGALKPVFISKKAAAAKASLGFRKCHDGRLPLDGFVLASASDRMPEAEVLEKYKPLAVPDGWKSSKASTDFRSGTYVSTADAAKSSNLDAKSRAALLGEKPLPGKSVFDFLSSSARDRIAAATGKSNLPAGLGEIPEGYAFTPEEKRKELQAQIPKVDPQTAAAALNRGSSGWMPYADNEDKRSRYQDYLEIQAGTRPGLPQRALTMSKDDWLKELQEFAHCAQIFKPMTGMMATRFTSSSSAPVSNIEVNNSAPLLSKPAAKPEDPAEEAAKVGMFGRMTRSEADFFPTRLLCKRFGVRAPAHVQPDAEKDGGAATASQTAQPISKSDLDDLLSEASRREQPMSSSGHTERTLPTFSQPVIDIERNEALEQKKPDEAVFKAIFGGDSDED